VPRGEVAVDLRAGLAGNLLGVDSGGPPVSALDRQALGLERLPSGNPKVVLYRVAVLRDDGE